METSSKQMSEDLIALVKHTKANIGMLAESHGLTHIQLYVLSAIHHGEVTMGQVASNLHCDASNVTGIIDRLVALGLVNRSESEQDRRTKVLHLTSKGRKVFDTITDKMPEALGCGKLKPAERSTLHRLITRLI